MKDFQLHNLLKSLLMLNLMKFRNHLDIFFFKSVRLTPIRKARLRAKPIPYFPRLNWKTVYRCLSSQLWLLGHLHVHSKECSFLPYFFVSLLIFSFLKNRLYYRAHFNTTISHGCGDSSGWLKKRKQPCPS